MELSLAKFENSRVRLEVSTLSSKLENERERFEILDREKSNLNAELNAKIVKLEELSQSYVQAVKDQARVPATSDNVHRQLTEHLTNLSEQHKTLQRDFVNLKDQCLIYQTKLTDAHMMVSSLKTQLDKEHAHREEL